MEQKLIAVNYSDPRTERELNEKLKDGWTIKQIAGAGSNLSVVCWVLLEKGLKSI